MSSKSSNEGKGRKRQRIESRKTTEKVTIPSESRKSAKKSSSSVNTENRKSEEISESKKSSKAIDTAESRKSGKSESSESRKSTGKSNESHNTRKSVKSSESLPSEPSTRSTNDSPKSTTKPKREVEKIFGITDQRGQLEFSIKFKKEDTVELIPTKIANVEYPQEVIKFYQERLVWKPNGIKC